MSRMMSVGRKDRMHIEIKESDVHSDHMKVALMRGSPDSYESILMAFVWLGKVSDGYEFSRCDIYSDLKKPAPLYVAQIFSDERFMKIINQHG